MDHRTSRFLIRLAAAAALAAGALPVAPAAQDRLPTMPGYKQFQKISQESRDAVKSGQLSVTWKDARTFEYVRDGRLYRYDVGARTTTEIGVAPAPDGRGGRGGRGGGGAPERGRQFESAESPDKTFNALYRNRTSTS